MKLKYIVDKEVQVKEYLEYVGLSHHLRKQVRRLDNIKVNGNKEKNYYNLKIGDVLELDFAEELNDEYQANFDDLEKLNILYEDEYLIVVSKDNNISSQPSRRHLKDNLLSILKAYFIKNNINSNIHLVNRLDYATSGIVMVAKSNICAFELTKYDIVKKYLAKVSNKFESSSGLIDLNIKREEAPSIKRYVSNDGQVAKTKYQVIEENDDYSLVELELLTGRCHQIRVHLSYLGHPIIGDVLYDGIKSDRLYLHAYYLKFYHPFLKQEIEIFDYPNW